MLRDFHLADFFTLGNAACGVGAVLFAMLYMKTQTPFHFFAAAALAPAAFAFDVFDGKIARARHQHSALGRELESLADIVSFGVAPATLAFAAGMQGGWDAAALIYFVCCGVSRLARFNVTAESMTGDAKQAYRPTLLNAKYMKQAWAAENPGAFVQGALVQIEGLGGEAEACSPD